MASCQNYYFFFVQEPLLDQLLFQIIARLACRQITCAEAHELKHSIRCGCVHFHRSCIVNMASVDVFESNNRLFGATNIHLS